MDSQNILMLVRRTPPTKYDQHEYGTLCKVTDDKGNEEVYIQLSKDTENPIWDKKQAPVDLLCNGRCLFTV